MKSSRIFATRLMLFCAGNAVADDVTVNRIFLVNLVCGLQSAVCSLQSAVCKCHTPGENERFVQFHFSVYHGVSL